MSDPAAPASSRGSFRTITGDEPFPGVVRRAFDSEQATVTRYDFAPGAEFPLHHHPQEQITLIEEGVVDFTVDGQRQTLGPGEWSIVAGGVEHGLRAGDVGARILAIIVPRRESAGAYTVTGERP